MFFTRRALIGFFCFLGLFLTFPLGGMAAVHAAGGPSSGHEYPLFLALALILVAAKVFHLIEKIYQPPVVGELLAGIVLGNLALFGLWNLNWVAQNEVMHFLAEFGVVILLFQIGLESNVKDLLGVGWRAIAVAAIGAAAPFVLGSFVLAPWLIPDISLAGQLFVGAALAATSVGITARVFQDFGAMKTKAARTFLSATIIDDNVGLILLAVVSAIAAGGTVTFELVALNVIKVIAFLVASILIGQLAAPHLGAAFSRINTGMGTKFTLAISFGLFFAYVAQAIGLEPIIGAFAAGLVLDPVHFRRFDEPLVLKKMRSLMPLLSKQKADEINELVQHHTHKNVEDLIEPLALFLVPIFFVMTGMGVDLSVVANLEVIGLSLAVTALAVFTKMIAALPVEKKDRWVVAFAMVPRGEVGLIFASVGRGLGVLDDTLFAVIVLSVLLTTIIGPTGLSLLLRKR